MYGNYEEYDYANGNNVWEEFLGSDPTLPAFPDAYTNYWIFSFKPADPNMGIRIRGGFGDFRYMNYTIYDVETRECVEVIKDVEIEPDNGSYNPFIDPAIENRTHYTIHLVPEVHEDHNLINKMVYDHSSNGLSLCQRIYDPIQDNYGGVGLPQLEAFNIISGQDMAIPEPFSVWDVPIDMEEIEALINLFFFFQTGKNIGFYNIITDRVFPNPDNQYLLTPITKKPGAVYIIRFKAPIFSTSQLPNQSTEVRYWSIMQCDEETHTYSGLKDKDAVIAQSDGFVNIVIADDKPELREKADGLNFMPLSVSSNHMILVYRNVMTTVGFSGDIANVPTLDLLNIFNIAEQQAQNYIGDYAPVGKRMTENEYLNNFGEFPVSY